MPATAEKVAQCRYAKAVAWSNYKANKAYAVVLRKNISRLEPLVSGAERLLCDLKIELAKNVKALRVVEG